MTEFGKFDGTFSALCGGHAPFRWQRRLFAEFLAGRVPQVCSLPTGFGKTSIIPIWLIALANSALANGGLHSLPRRLVYIVNRRTVVDQATQAAENVRDALKATDDSAPHAQRLRDVLRSLCAAGNGEVLAISTLRGEMADNREWSADPARPAIVVGTVDMIGSKLLFSGYGDGRYGRAHHAGLIGQDTLIVHDEAHLSPAFSRLLWTIEREQRKAGDLRPLCVLELSATSRDDPEAAVARQAVWALRGATGNSVFTVAPEDNADLLVTRRLAARKVLSIEPSEGGKGGLPRAILAKALSYRDASARVLVYVRSPEDAREIANGLTNAKTGLGPGAEDRVRLLTGTIRGHERDQLAESRFFQEFKSAADRPRPAHTLYLICTSAGEVGVDLDADHLICDLTTLDSMAQRFGRVNRLGGDDRRADVTVFWSNAGANAPAKPRDTDPLAAAVSRTGEILAKVAQGGGDVSPDALTGILASSAAADAFSPVPEILPATDILFDYWALTSIIGDLPGRPDAETYLHGLSEYDPPETYVAWRAEVTELAKADTPTEDLVEMLDEFPLRAAERLRDRVDRVQRELALLAARCPNTHVIVIRTGAPVFARLTELAPPDKPAQVRAQRLLAHATVILPTEVGGLRNGMLDGTADDPVLDVGDLAINLQRARQRVRVSETGEATLSGDQPLAHLPCRCTLLVPPANEDEDVPKDAIEYRVAGATRTKAVSAIPLSDHVREAENAARSTAAALKLPADIIDALCLAARHHDSGKARDVWQQYACNKDTNQPLAKSSRYGDPRMLHGYRHEFGSLLDTMLAIGEQAPAGGNSGHTERDLILHLIAAHHGWARPHFHHDHRSSAYDPAPRAIDASHKAAMEVMQRYARLQQRFGRWGLAWLESLLRCADAVASLPSDKGDQP